jgi:peptide/nickel transport system permease protein
VVPEVDIAFDAPVPGARGLRAGNGVLLATAALLGRNVVVRVVVRRLLLAVPLLFVVSATSFLLLALAPGDAANQILGAHGTPDQYAALRRALGLDLPVYEQYWHWLHHALTGDLGTSIVSGAAVAPSIADRLPVTAALIAGALLVSVAFGLGLGVLSAVRGGRVGRVAATLSLVGYSLPAFWVGAELIVLFAVKLQWFPATGYVPFGQSPLDWLRSLVLPVSALSLYGIAAVARQAREAMLGVLASEHIRMAHANGIPIRSIVFRHALRNASVPVVTVLGVVAVGLLGGTVFVESVFALPGLGSLVVNGSLQGDIPVVQGVAVFFTLIVVLVNLAIDLAYTWLDPRIRSR